MMLRIVNIIVTCVRVSVNYMLPDYHIEVKAKLISPLPFQVCMVIIVSTILSWVKYSVVFVCFHHHQKHRIY